MQTGRRESGTAAQRYMRRLQEESWRSLAVLAVHLILKTDYAHAARREQHSCSA